MVAMKPLAVISLQTCLAKSIGRVLINGCYWATLFVSMTGLVLMVVSQSFDQIIDTNQIIAAFWFLHFLLIWDFEFWTV